MPHDPLLTISVFARRSRLSLKALRLYDRLGLLAPAEVDPATGYRRYRESQLERARTVAQLRRLDLPLAAVGEILAAPAPDGARLLAAYWQGVERRVAQQRELAVHLRIRLSGGMAAGGNPEMFDIHEREVPEQLVLTERRHVRLEELPAWIGAATDRLVLAAGQYGGAAGAPFVLYHGEVNEDGDGPVEVCVPVPDGTVGARREPAHREAYTRLTKAQVQYPQIISAFDAVAHWLDANERQCTGASREVYFAEWSTAGPADLVCDVAFPVSYVAGVQT